MSMKTKRESKATLPGEDMDREIPVTLEVITEDGTVIDVPTDDEEISASDVIQKFWPYTELPKFEGRKALVLGGAFYGDGVGLMAEAGFERAKTVEEADVVVFMGGADVDPSFYNQKALSCTTFNNERDVREKAIYEECLRLGKVMFGICRGAQFLHVMNGGELWQDVQNHAGPDHFIYDHEEDYYLIANSYHHQMLMLNDTIEVLASCPEQVSKRFVSSDFIIDLDKEGSNTSAELEIEAGYYNDTKCFFVQGHPECSNPEYRSWCMTKLFDLMLEWEQPVSAETELSIEEKVQAWKEASQIG